MPPIRSIEAHRTLDCRQRFVGAPEKGCIVPGEPVSDRQPGIHRQRLLDGPPRFLELSRRGVQHALDTFRDGMPRREVERDRDRLAAEVG